MKTLHDGMNETLDEVYGILETTGPRSILAGVFVADENLLVGMKWGGIGDGSKAPRGCGRTWFRRAKRRKGRKRRGV
jgi:hypothetical protein